MFIDINTNLGVDFGVFYIVLALLGLWFKKPLVSFFLATISTTCILIGWYYSPENTHDWVVILSRGISILITWAVASFIFFSKRKQVLSSFEEFDAKANKQYIRYIVFLTLFATIGIFSISYIYINKFNRIEKDYIIEQEKRLDTLKTKTKTSLHELFSDLILLTKLNTTKNIFADEEAKQNLAKDFVELMKMRKLYDQVRFIDLKGEEVIRVNYNKRELEIVSPNNLQNKKNREYFKETITLNYGEIYVSKIDLNFENGKIEIPYKPVVRVSTLVKDNNQKIIGILVINYLASELLNNNKINSEGASNNLELLNESGYWLAGVEQEKLFGFINKNKNTYASIYAKVWNNIKSRKKGVIKNNDTYFIHQKFSLIDVFYEDFKGVTHIKTTNNPELIIVSSISDENLLRLAKTKFQELIFIIIVFILVCVYVLRYLLKKQKELNYTNQLFEEAQNIAKIGVWRLNIAEMKVYWSDEVYRIHEVEVGTVMDVSKGIEFYHQDYRDTIQKAIDKAISEKKSWDEEAILITAKGKELWVRAIGYPVFDKGELRELRGLFMDIDDKKRAQLADVESKEKLKELNLELENLLGDKTKKLEQTSHELIQHIELIDSATIISITDLDGTITHVNDTFCENSGYLREELIGQNHRMLNSKKHSKTFFKEMYAALDDGLNWKGEICNKRKDGSLYWVSTFIAPFKDSLGKKSKYVSIRFDISLLKQQELALKKQAKKLELVNSKLDSVNKELEIFSYSVSHDLKAPLRALQGFSDNLHKKYIDQLDETGIRWLTFIKDNAERMNQLIIDILSFSRINRKDIDKKENDANRIVSEVIDRAKLIYKNKLDLHISELPNSKADHSMIEMVWENLINNAFKYSSKNDTISIKIEGFKDKEYTYYSIIDNGTGFDMKYYDKLFGVFQRLHANDEFEGTGVGLASVKKILEKHGGEIKAESTLGEGAKFEFKLPN